MFGRKSKTAVAKREASAGGSRAVEAVGEAASDLAERAVAAAQTAQRAATPVLKSAAERSGPVLRSAAEKSAESLSHAAERAAVVLADTAERLADSGEVHVARHRLADVSESLAKAVRPKKRRRARKLFAVLLLAGGIAALVRSPLKSKLADRLFGAPPEFDDDEPESITLPSSASQPVTDTSEPGESPAPAGSAGEAPAAANAEPTSPPDSATAAEHNGTGESKGVASSATGRDEGSQG